MINRNGLTKGNGLINGNGLTNGSGLINGNGLVNGNGLTNGNGLFKGKELLMVNGLINGNGITNGNGFSRGSALQKNRQFKGNKKRVVATRMVVAVILLLVPYLCINLPWPVYDEEGIYIDGNLSDWKNIPGCEDPAEDQIAEPSVNIVNYRLNFDSAKTGIWQAKLSLYLEVAETMFGRPSKISEGEPVSYAVHILIDSDTNPDTGYHVNGMGADSLIEVTGQDGAIHSSQLKVFDNDEDHGNWNGFEKKGTIPSAANNRVLECQIYIHGPEQSNADVLFHTVDSRGNEDFSDTVLSSSKGRLTIIQKSIGPDVLSVGARDVGLLHLNISALDSDVTIQSFNVTLSGTARPTDLEDISVFCDDGGGAFQENHGPLTTARIAGNKAEITPVTPLKIKQGETLMLIVSASISHRAVLQRVMCLSLASRDEITLEQGTVTVKSSLRMVYIGAIPDDVKIDGAFGEWPAIHGFLDADDLPVEDDNIDFNEYKITSDEGSLFLYFRVEGSMMAGSPVPMIPEHVPYRDIPIPKAVTKRVAGGKGSEIVELRNDLPEELSGEDTLLIFIDTDQDKDSGFSKSWLPLGAEHLIHISGKSGMVVKKAVFSFYNDTSLKGSLDIHEPPSPGNRNLPAPSGWSESNSQRIEAAAIADQMEVEIETETFGGEGLADIFFILTDWNGDDTDSSDTILSKNTENGRSTRANNPVQSSAVHPNSAENSDGDTLDPLNLDEDANGDDVYEQSGDKNEPAVDWIEVSFPSAGIPENSIINNITYYFGYYTNDGWQLTTDEQSNITWRVNATQNDLGDYSLSSPADTDIDTVFSQTTNLPTLGNLNLGNLTVRFRGVDGGTPPADNFYLDYCYFKVNYSLPDIVINEVMFDPAGSDANSEWVELYNADSSSINITGWKLVSSNSTFNITWQGSLEPNSYIVIHLGASGTSNSTDIYGDLTKTTFFQPENGTDTRFQTNNSNFNYGQGNTLYVGNRTSVPSVYRGLIQWNISSIPSTATILSANMSLYLYGTVGTAPSGTVSLHNITQPWTEGTGLGLDEGNASWDNRTINTPWGSPGGDYNSTSDASITIAYNAGWYVWESLESRIQDWVSGIYANNGFLIKSGDETSNIRYAFYSSEYTESEKLPLLNITYSSSSTMLRNDADFIYLRNSAGQVIDFMAYGSDPQAGDDPAVSQGIWDEGDYINTTYLLEGQTLGRDMSGTDTDQPEDWENATGYADPFGKDRSTVNGSTPGSANSDVIPEFSEIVLPFMIIFLVFAVWRRRRKEWTIKTFRNPGKKWCNSTCMIDKRWA